MPIGRFAHSSQLQGERSRNFGPPERDPHHLVEGHFGLKTTAVVTGVLAPVWNDRKSAGKTTAVRAGLRVSPHAGAVVGGKR